MKEYGYFQPAEWVPHKACWLAWPSDKELWLENLNHAQREFTDLCHAIADLDPKTGSSRGETLNILVRTQEDETLAKSALKALSATFHKIPYGDIWLRDTAPIFLMNRKNQLASACFQFNGWGEKYVLPYDADLAHTIAKKLGVQQFSLPWILEGGSLDVDGEGSCLTTKQCLLNPNRNPEMGLSEIEQRLRDDLGIEKVLWLNEGLLNDHTDGHIDTLARFVEPGVVVCMYAKEPENDPNTKILNEIIKDLESFTDAKGRRLKVIKVPSPGKLVDEEGKIMPGSYMNFYIANTTVVVPTYGSRFDDEAVKQISSLFPTRKTVGLSARFILSGGGAFHCITQQVPKGG